MCWWHGARYVHLANQKRWYISDMFVFYLLIIVKKKEIKQGLLPQFESVYPFLVCLISDTGFEGEESCKQYEG